MKNLLFLLIALSCVYCSCESGKSNQEPTNINKVVDQFADLECRAVMLREQRFELARKIRFTQDTLMATSKKNDTLLLKQRLDLFNKDKEVLLSQSLALADSIKHTMSHLFDNTFKTPEERKTFNALLEKSLETKGCNRKEEPGT